MSLTLRIESSSVITVPDDIAAELAGAYDALKDLPVNRMLTTDPFGPEDYDGPAKVDGKDVTDEYKSASNARKFVKQGKSWAATQTGPNGRPLKFARKGDVKGNPTVVSFRIYEVRETETPAE
jgi:hypothetical protein